MEIKEQRNRTKLDPTPRQCSLFFYSRGIGHHKFAPPSQTVNRQFYVEVPKLFKARLFCVRPDLGQNNFFSSINIKCLTKRTLKGNEKVSEEPHGR